ncbi:MAG: hypothetical protein KDA80_02245 [Planctomycetaceae bacterium]|nr:hypothetical protein [Planctomycetaceae bacterium]
MDTEFLTQCLSWPAFPFTFLLGLVMVYWLMVIFGGGIDMIDLDLDMDVDMDADVSGSLADWGMMGVKWFNLGDVPLMLWMSILALTSWLVTMTFDKDMAAASNWQIVGVILRNLGIGLFAAKVVTQPLKGKLKHKEPHPPKEMLGMRCTVKTGELTPEFGQIECPIEDGAPLYLNARTAEGTIPRGAVVEIIEYHPDSRLYYVRGVDA